MRFLIVDDDSLCRELLRVTLSPYARCDLAFDGTEAIDAVRLALQDGRPYDLICLDIMMPGSDGHEVLDAIRQMEHARGIVGSDGTKIIMTTAVMDSKHCIRAFEEGCESYYTKPIHAAEFLEKVGELVGELRQADDAAAALASPTSPLESAEGGRGRDAAPRRDLDCLIVDDDGVCRALLEAILSPFGRCTFAYDGREAVDAVRLAQEDGRRFDLICLDIMMPGLDGHGALKAIRELEQAQGILGSDGVKVIMTTALRDSKHCIRSFKEGCESYVTKPIDEQELLDRMRELGVLETSDVS